MHAPIEILEQNWGFSCFKGSQEKIINAIINKQDVLALMPTGGGKSLCYQVPALAQDGICIVVSPLIALIHNQVDNLKSKGIKAVALTGGIPFNEVIDLLDNCMFGNYKFLYLSPERLQQDIVQERILKMKVSLIAIDEAHCISQWGHDFRPAYLACANLKEVLPNTPIIALTATATQQVATDIITLLNFNNPLIVKDSFVRKNIAFKIFKEEDKRYRLKQLCQSNNQSAIVYVRTRRLTQEVAQFLNANGTSATFYHGGIPKKEKKVKLNLWLDNKVQVMVATNAFGMGIDKPDVGLVVHYQIPECIENYYQEAGRAGRNGEAAQAVLITNTNDVHLAKEQFLSVLPDTQFLKRVYNKLNNYFQIAYGQGEQTTFQLNFNQFCSTYSLNALLAYNSLQILDQNSVIALSESFYKKSKVQFISTKSQLFDYFEKNQKIAPIVQTILRTYGGIFDFETKIDISLLAKKTSASEHRVTEVLDQLKKDDLIEYVAQHSDLEITFLVPREDEITINVFAKKVKERQQIKVHNLEQMLHYIETDFCRSRQLLRYFEETVKEDCGICDICILNNKSTKNDTPAISSEILVLLKVQPYTSRQIIATLKYSQNAILETIQELLEEGLLKINSKNQYEIE